MHKKPAAAELTLKATVIPYHLTDSHKMSQSLLARLGVEHPIIQAPMAGGATTPELVSAVCEAGALGFVGAAYLSPAQILELTRAVRARTSRPFGLNLFAPVDPTPPPSDVRPALDALTVYHSELRLPAPAIPDRAIHDFDEQLAAALESGATVFSFTFGLLPHQDLERLRSRGIMIIGTATTVDEAIALERTGVDAIVAQGSEAGAHRGTFAVPFESALIGTMALVPQIADAVRVPVIASGGIMDGRGLAAAFALGAEAVQMGTAFLTTEESGVPSAYKEAILSARETDTRVTRAFSGRAARGLVNRFMDEVESRGPAANLGYPLQNALTRPLRSEAAKQNRPELLSLWAGQGVRLARHEPAGMLVRRVVAEASAAIRQLESRVAVGR
jgi:nitronate monooxygenase